ncbi:MAG: DNA-processing protein DprA, partial [Candidatus Saccharimonadales bacterium]
MTVIKLKLSDKEFPARLRQLSSPPEHINISGNELEEMLSKPTLGVVGSRKATEYGKNITESLVSSAVDKNVVIVSGLALGIDS